MRGLRSRLLILVAVAALPVLAVVVVDQIDERERRRAVIAAELQQVAALKAAQLDRMIEGLKHALLVLVRHPAVAERRDEECGLLLQTLLDKMDLVGAGSFVSPEGDVFCRPPADPGALREARDFIEGRYFRAAVGSGQATVGELVAASEATEARLPLAQPLMPGDDRIDSVALLSLRPDALRGLLSQARLPEGGISGVVGPGNRVVARVPGVPGTVGEEVSFLASPPAPPGIVTGRGRDGVERLYGVAQSVAARDLTIYVGVSRAQVFADADRQFLRELGLIVLAFVVAGGAALWIGESSIRRPILRLRSAVAGVAGGDMTAGQVATDGGTAQELSDLAAAFGAMAARLAALLDEKDGLLRQKDLLMREVDHRVKNSLAMVSSLLSLQARRSSDPATREQLQEAISRVQAVAQVHGQLYQADGASSVDLLPYLQALTDHLCASAPDWVCGVQGDSVRLPAQRAASLGILFSELVTNAFKHGRPPKDRRRLDAALGRLPDGRIEVTVRDFGAGLPEGFSLSAASETLGMLVVTSMARNLEGELTAEAADPGTRWRLRLPQ